MGPRASRASRLPLALQALEERTLFSFTPLTVAAAQRPLPTGTASSTAVVFLSESVEAAAFGTNVTLVARVLSSSAAGTTGDTIDFFDQVATGPVLLAAVPVQNNTAAFTWSGASVGTHQLVAELASTDASSGGASAPVSLTISPAATRTVLTTRSQKLVASVTGANAIATGTLSFFAGTRELATVALSPKGTATLPTAAMRNSTQPIVAAYNGSADFSPSTSSIYTLHLPRWPQNFSFAFRLWS
jgi:hypothetical protein